MVISSITSFRVFIVIAILVLFIQYHNASALSNTNKPGAAAATFPKDVKEVRRLFLLHVRKSHNVNHHHRLHHCVLTYFIMFVFLGGFEMSPSHTGCTLKSIIKNGSLLPRVSLSICMYHKES